MQKHWVTVKGFHVRAKSSTIFARNRNNSLHQYVHNAHRFHNSYTALGYCWREWGALGIEYEYRQTTNTLSQIFIEFSRLFAQHAAYSFRNSMNSYFEFSFHISFCCLIFNTQSSIVPKSEETTRLLLYVFGQAISHTFKCNFNWSLK